MNWIEILGYFSSLLIIVSLLMSSIVKLRWINLGGAVLMVVYAIVIKAYPVIILNAITIVINFYHLLKLYFIRENFKILKIEEENKYYDYFFQFYENEIHQEYSDFQIEDNHGKISFCVLRNLVTAGIYLCERQDNILKVNLEFVIPEYRDCKVGIYVYHHSKEFFSSMGYEFFHVRAVTQHHQNYLRKIGFKESTDNPEIFVKRVDL